MASNVTSGVSAYLKNSHVCSDHFKPECSERNLKSELLGTKAIRHLKPNAVSIIIAKRTGRKRAHAAVAGMTLAVLEEMESNKQVAIIIETMATDCCKTGDLLNV
ncbi:uncharacterized protein LOC134194457 [Corticium candelabrum]|uniref:uncharacterized protein LOC134194457 n=1 Tax=Corticium candelabrum TaxID=121492 RepID=UPI002E26A006|nr:uncharacterized protein LOC134194457 [Corticium candelabrum]